MRSRTSIAILAVAAACLLASGVGAAGAQTPRVCQWGGTQPDPTGELVIHPGLTHFPSPYPLRFKAWGPLSGGPGCTGTMTFVGQLDAGSTCSLRSGVLGTRAGLPGGRDFSGAGGGPFGDHLLNDTQGQAVGGRP